MFARALCDTRSGRREGDVLEGIDSTIDAVVEAIRVSTYRALMDRVGAALPRLSHRARVAVAAACADRAFPLLSRQHGVLSSDRALIGDDLASSALEVPWSFAMGEEVSRDEAKWLEQRLSDVYDELHHDLHGYEGGAINTLLGALRAVASADERGARLAIDGLIDLVDRFEALDAERDWIERVLDRAAHTADEDLTRHLFDDPAPPRWLVHVLSGLGPDDPQEDDPDEAAYWAERLSAATSARIAAVRERRAREPVPCWRPPSGIPERWTVREVGRAPSSSEGIVSTPGDRHYGLFDAASGALLFAPPSAVALGMTPDLATLIAWRVEKRAGCSGIARGDYDWILERYRWPEASFSSSHTITSRKVIEWHWTGALDVPLEGDGRHVVLRTHSEDDFLRLHVVTMRDGSVRETQSHEEALRWLAED